ncbi:MAG: hypothetical protein HY814_01740 [Candidatus Riflebacteria bacterium]|nr:hypothetical protein [Candidatus Riflebacteria bacterium]
MTSEGEIQVKVLRVEDAALTDDDLHTLAALLAHVIEQPTLSGRILGWTVGRLASLPDWLSPLTGLLPLALRNTLSVLDGLPSLQLPLLRLRPWTPARRGPVPERIPVR